MRRYDLEWNPGCGYGTGSEEMAESDDGLWVRYEDVAALEAANTNLRAEIERLRRIVPRVTADDLDALEEIILVVSEASKKNQEIRRSLGLDVASARDEVEGERRRGDMFAKIVRDVAGALGQEVGDNTSDLGIKVRRLREEQDKRVPCSVGDCPRRYDDGKCDVPPAGRYGCHERAIREMDPK